MAHTMSGIQAGLAEAADQGLLIQAGRKIEYRGNDGFTVSWSAKTDKLAAQQLRIFRAAPKHIKVAT